MKGLRWLGLLVGLLLFALVLRTGNVPEVWKQVSHLRWRFGMVLAFYVVIFGLDTVGWRYALRQPWRGRLRLDQLFRTRLAGEALNYVTPTAWVGGEPVKAYLLSTRHGVPMTDGMASVVVAKTTFTVSMLTFIMTGLAVALLTQPIPPALWRWVILTLTVLVGLIAVLVAVQCLAPFRRGIAALVRRLPSGLRPLDATVREWDRAITTFYHQSPRGVLGSFGFHFLGWLAGVGEVFLILRLLQIPVSVVTAWSVEALWLLLKSCAFLIPASLGASEGFLLLVCAGLGINAVSGLALGLIRRARELVWVGLGLVEFSRGP